MEAKNLKIGKNVFLLKFHKGIYDNPAGYKKVGLYTVEEITERMILLRKNGSGYAETVNIVDLRQRIYRLQLEDGTEVKFPPMVNVKKLEQEEKVKSNIEIEKIKEEEKKIMDKLTKEIAKKMTSEGMTVREIAEQFVETYPKMKLSMIMAKVTMLLSDKRPGKPKKQKTDGTKADIIIADEFATAEVNSHEEHPVTEADICKTSASILDRRQLSKFKKQYEVLKKMNPPCILPVEAAAAEIKELADIVDRQVTEAAKSSGDKIKLSQAVDEMMEMIPDSINHPEDSINHPMHYTSGKIEVIDYIQDKLTPEQFEGFCIGVVMQYVSRYRLKGGMDDLKKAQWYLNRIIESKQTA
jgi:hypothetical protein